MSGDPRLKGADVRYGGRTARFTILINTDAKEEDLKKLVFKLRDVARGPQLDMVVVTVDDDMSLDDGKQFWTGIIKSAHRKVAEES